MTKSIKNNNKGQSAKDSRKPSFFWKQFLSYIFIFVAITLAFAFFDVGLAWDKMIDDREFTWTAWATLILYRLLIYAFPALCYWILYCRKQWRGLINCYNNQFFAYTIIIAIYNLFALDYVLKVDLMNKMDGFIVLVGLVLSIVMKRKIPQETLKQIEE